jgi:hypothetical protein
MVRARKSCCTVLGSRHRHRERCLEDSPVCVPADWESHEAEAELTACQLVQPVFGVAAMQ